MSEKKNDDVTVPVSGDVVETTQVVDNTTSTGLYPGPQVETTRSIYAEPVVETKVVEPPKSKSRKPATTAETE